MYQTAVIEAADFQSLLDTLKTRGFTPIGPTVQDGAIVYDEIDSAADLPMGWTDVQGVGSYRIEKSSEPQYFGYTVTPFSWKKYLHPPAVRILQAEHGSNGNVDNLVMNSGWQESPPAYAFVGVRPCELRAIQILDKIFLNGSVVDPVYQQRRANTLIIAVNCSQAGDNCFCVSVGGGPQADKGYDISLTEVLEGGSHYFVAHVGSEAGRRILDAVPNHPASETVISKAKTIIAATARNMGRQVNTDGLKQVLYDNMEHPRWDSVASRCLACANCTMVCPTCFCNTVEDVTDLTGEHAERWRKWDSCFTSDFSYIHGGNVRQTGKSRYRQWATHKFASWQDQFDSLGCVGCGRCITWCPGHIDITEEINAIRSEDKVSRN